MNHPRVMIEFSKQSMSSKEQRLGLVAQEGRLRATHGDRKCYDLQETD